jgi:hypothetical protein
MKEVSSKEKPAWGGTSPGGGTGLDPLTLVREAGLGGLAGTAGAATGLVPCFGDPIGCDLALEPPTVPVFIPGDEEGFFEREAGLGGADGGTGFNPLTSEREAVLGGLAGATGAATLEPSFVDPIGCDLPIEPPAAPPFIPLAGDEEGFFEREAGLGGTGGGTGFNPLTSEREAVLGGLAGATGAATLEPSFVDPIGYDLAIEPPTVPAFTLGDEGGFFERKAGLGGIGGGPGFDPLVSESEAGLGGTGGGRVGGLGGAAGATLEPSVVSVFVPGDEDLFEREAGLGGTGGGTGFDPLTSEEAFEFELVATFFEKSGGSLHSSPARFSRYSL